MRQALILFLLFSTTCTKDAIEHTVISIRSGKTFGFCVGYCDRALTLGPDTAFYVMNPTRETGLASKQCILEVDGSQWSQATGLVDDAFFALEEVYGCPDCRDQGAEWVEVITTERRHLVRFDPTLDVDIHPLVENQRAWRLKFEETTPCN